MTLTKAIRNQTVIVILTAITALVHLILLNISMGKIDPLFTLNGLGYLALLAAFVLPIAFLKPYHGWIRWAFIAFTAVTVVAWIAIGDKSFSRIGLLGYLTKLVELVLIYLLWREK